MTEVTFHMAFAGRLVRLAALALLTISAVSVAFVPRAVAAPTVNVSCGEIITADTVVANDLIDCPRHGLVIGASNITLDLNGHTIDGNGVLFEPCPEDEPCNAGIANSGIRDGRPINGEGYDGVTIKNGSVREFAEGSVYIVGASKNRVRGLTMSTSVYGSDGVHLRNCTSCRIESSSAADVSVGLVVERSHDVQVLGNDVHDNGFAGILVALSDNVQISRNSAHDNSDADGITLLADARDNFVTDNAVFGNGGGIGISDGSDSNVVTRNSVHDNAFVGVFVNGSDGNRFERNVIARNGEESVGQPEGSEGGIHVSTNDQGDTSDRSTFSRNVLSDNFGDGLLLDAGQVGTSIERNVADKNTDDGIDVNSRMTTLTRNTADRNGDLGIEAVHGVVDNGGNRASGNGDPRQCTNVECASKGRDF